ncbi:MAG: SoxR reducing system RseC family protein [Thiothrix sp.]
MIEQTAVVVSVDSGHAWIMPQQSGKGCGACAGKAGCAATASAFQFWQKEPQRMRVLNPLYARPGDTVVVGMQGNALVLYSALAYLLPLLGLIMAALIGQGVFTWFGLLPEIGAILSGFAGLFGGLRLANLLCARSFASEAFQPVILRVVGQSDFVSLFPAVQS